MLRQRLLGHVLAYAFGKLGPRVDRPVRSTYATSVHPINDADERFLPGKKSCGTCPWQTRMRMPVTALFAAVEQTTVRDRAPYVEFAISDSRHLTKHLKFATGYGRSP